MNLPELCTQGHKQDPLISELNSIREQQRLLKKILDKGGVTVVMLENKLVTTYSYGSRK